MNTSPYYFQRLVPFRGLRSEQRSLVEHVFDSTHVKPRVRQKAQALLLLDKGESFDHITETTSLAPRALRTLISQHAKHGVRVALLGKSVIPGSSDRPAKAS